MLSYSRVPQTMLSLSVIVPHTMLSLSVDNDVPHTMLSPSSAPSSDVPQTMFSPQLASDVPQTMLSPSMTLPAQTTSPSTAEVPHTMLSDSCDMVPQTMLSSSPAPHTTLVDHAIWLTSIRLGPVTTRVPQMICCDQSSTSLPNCVVGGIAPIHAVPGSCVVSAMYATAIATSTLS